jgi:hypothetical protein
VQLLVVDHDSTDESSDVARRAGAAVLKASGGGPASIRNLAARHATGSILAFVDADHEIVDSWLRVAVDALADRGVGAAGSAYEPPPEGTWVQQMYGALRGRSHGCHDVAWLGAGNLAVRASAFREINGFDTALETCEDVDFCQRLRRAGYRVVSDERLRSVHHGDPATLKALLMGELWRGRDNIRVSLRGPLNWRNLPSLLVPVAEVAIPFVTVAGFLVSPRAGSLALITGLVLVGGVAAARATVMLRRIGDCRPLSIVRALAVSTTYDLGRAAALIVKVGHGRRRGPVEARTVDA